MSDPVPIAETTKSKTEAIRDWLLVFNAVMQMRPPELFGTSITDHAIEVRKVAQSKIDHLWDEWKKRAMGAGK